MGVLDEQLEAVEAKIAERAAADEKGSSWSRCRGWGTTAPGDRLADRRHRAIQAARQPGDFFGLTPGCRNSGEATQRPGSITKQGSKIVRYLLEQAVQGVVIRRRHAGMVQADQEASRGKDWPGGGDATPDDDHLAHALAERERPLRVTIQNIRNLRPLKAMPTWRERAVRIRDRRQCLSGAVPRAPKDLCSKLKEE